MYPSTDRHGFWLSTAPARISPPALTVTVTASHSFWRLRKHVS